MIIDSIHYQQRERSVQNKALDKKAYPRDSLSKISDPNAMPPKRKLHKPGFLYSLQGEAKWKIARGQKMDTKI